jgi:hypothetical protein
LHSWISPDERSEVFQVVDKIMSESGRVKILKDRLSRKF